MADAHSLRVYIMRIQLSHQVLYRIGSSCNLQNRLNSFVNSEKPSSVIKGHNIIVHDLSIIASTFCTNLDPGYKNELIKRYKAYKYNGPPVLPSGNAELFNSSILEFELRRGTSLLVPCLFFPTYKGQQPVARKIRSVA